MFFVGLGSLVLLFTFTPLPATSSVSSVQEKESIPIVDRSGFLLFDLSQDTRRKIVPIEEISPNIIKATIAIEDTTFYSHKGIRPIAFFRALLSNLKTLSFSQGGSTITQQVIKNVLLTRDKKIIRKLKEFILAPKLEKELSKNDILELYLNHISYGGVVAGVSQAANAFFGKNPSEVTLAEAAYLAAVPRAPTFYSPYGNNKKALETRKNLVLKRLFDTKTITKEEYQQAIREFVFFTPRKRFEVHAPHFVFFVQEKLKEKYGSNLFSLQGTTIKTTLDYELQQEVEVLISDFAPGLLERRGANNLSALVLNTSTGEILTMVGSKDYFNEEIGGEVNVTTSQRQPGSSFKPFVYATAFEKGFSPENVLFDVQTQFFPECEEDLFESTKDGCYSPVNYDGLFRGPITMRSALAQSINVPAVKTLYLAGVRPTLSLARSAGIKSLSSSEGFYGLSLALGGGDLSPLELANAYRIFPNEGVYSDARWSFDDKSGGKKQVLSGSSASTITSILSDNEARSPVFGLNSPLHFRDRQVAAKTGTTNNSRDLWVVGYDPNITVLVWGGNNDGEPLSRNAAGFSIAPLFKQVFLAASRRYSAPHTRFSPSLNTHTKPEDSFDSWDGRGFGNLHSILHYIDKSNPSRARVRPEDDSQYSHWEFGVSLWLEERKNEEMVVLFNKSRLQNKILDDEGLIILSPENKTLSVGEEYVVFVAATGGLPSLYEFYINNTFISATSAPSTTIRINPDWVVGGEIILTVIAHTSGGQIRTEKKYHIKN